MASCLKSHIIKYINPHILLQQNCRSKHIGHLSYLSPCNYDLVVLGLSSGGFAAAKEAISLGAKVAIIAQGLQNPCVTRKLIREAALLGESIDDSKGYGWQVENEVSHNWTSLRNVLQTHAKFLISKTEQELRDKNIKCFNAEHFDFQDAQTVIIKTKEGNLSLIAKHFVMALRGLPRYPDIPGALHYGITNENLLSLEKAPGQTLVIGGGPIGLETAGVLNSFGYDTSIMVRSIPLKTFDRQMVGMVMAEMESRGVKFLIRSFPKSIEKLKTGKLKVEWTDSVNYRTATDIFDTVIFAIGRTTENEHYTDIIPHMYSLDQSQPTSVAIYAGKLLSRRLFGGSKETMDYKNIATTIFTMPEYGFVGISEETAMERFGEANFDVYHSFYKPVEFSVAKKSAANCYLKVIATRGDEQKVLGMHLVGPHAGEVVQGFSAAMNCNLTIESLMSTVGIHPTSAEEFTRINITKRSGRDPTPASCCS